MNHAGQRLDYDRITPLIFIGTNACCSTHFADELLEKGVRADISLESARIDTPFGIDFYVWLPTKDHTAPSPEKLAFGVDTLKFFTDNKIPCYVHCKNGHGRAPTLVAAYLISEREMTVDDAVAVVEQKRNGAHIEPAQRAALVEFEIHLKRFADDSGARC
jgi:hypothetical protein